MSGEPSSRNSSYGNSSLFTPRNAPTPERYIIAHIDGGARGNPGPAGYGVVVSDSAGKHVAELSEYIGHKSNNVAEYSGLLGALKYSLQHGERALKVISDSELMVKQLNGVYKVKSPDLKVLYDEAQTMIRRLDWFRAEHVLRAKNKDADRLANEAMDRGMRRGDHPEGAARESVRVPVAAAAMVAEPREFNGIVQSGKVVLLSGELPEGTLVKVRVKT
jgi:ribonuclease HI